MTDYQLIYERLVDDESRTCFEARNACLTDSSLAKFYSTIRKVCPPFRFKDLPQPECCGFALWDDNDDRVSYHTLLLQDAGYRVVGPYVSEEERISLVIHQGYVALVPHQLCGTVPEQIPSNKIICVEDHLIGKCGWHYFDYFEPQAGECFLDGGALDGYTTTQFIQWCSGQYDSIYVFEPNPLQKNMCRDNLRKIGGANIHFYDQALWNRNETLPFAANPILKWDAHISENGQYFVVAATADSLLDKEKVTFIKLDVEGAELQVLKGAEHIILRNRPRMAVSIYHNPEDFIQIPLYLLSLVPDYRFAIRHYHSDLIETLLYVF